MMYVVVGAYLIKYPIDFGPHIPKKLLGVALLLYGFLRAYRVYEQWRQDTDE